MSGLDKADLPPDARADIRSVPSMIYYGVPTVDAVLMRSLGVRRSLSVGLGNRFRQQVSAGVSAPRLQQARTWLAATSDALWQQASQEAESPMDGRRIRRVWEIVTGSETEGTSP
jgi:hypothetical protein